LSQQFVPGQRWISEAEPQLGLGTILKVDHRMVTIVFIASGETRNYAKDSAPLARVQFKKGDAILSHEGWGMVVTHTKENSGIITYFGTTESGNSTQLEEGLLNNFIQLNRPVDRLFSGQIDADKWFDLRIQTLYNQKKFTHSEIRGLLGSRTNLLPHQIYIAQEVARRFAPRVLLADEVGLGKTIEAGMILHQQLLTGLCKRVLIVVPDPLVNQWLVELIRRFNLRFSIFDEERCIALEESSEIANPFQNEQLVICSIDFLTDSTHRHEQLLDGQWDMMVVDEAHHLEWTPEKSSPKYQIVEALSRVSKGVLLLTATPEQLGKNAHFARLRLLDPARFHSIEAFEEEQRHYAPVASLIEKLIDGEKIENSALDALRKIFNDENILPAELNSATDEQRLAILNKLLDTHGTGRILFRNTRHAIKGFPERKLHAYPLELPAEYREPLAEIVNSGITNPQLFLSPERLFQQVRQHPHWTDFDPRIDWLCTRLRTIRPEKCLLITANKQTALELAQALREREGIIAGVFHEDLSIIERDRAATFFADTEGSQLLICSEIGSEGRNFQFAHHLVLFDLPFVPDLLEQRIGRLDRIGQRHTINIHVPYLNDTAQAYMYRWYHEGLNAFEQICHVGQTIFDELGDTLLQGLHQIDTNQDFDLLIQTSRDMYQKYTHELHAGRDKLLEFNSCRSDVAENLISTIKKLEAPERIQDFMELIFDCFGVEIEDHIENCFILRPNPHMPVVAFPELPEDGVTISYDRNTALHHENVQFISWEHPMVLGAMDMILTQELGNTCVAALETKVVPRGTLLTECFFRVESEREEIQATMPPQLFRVLIDHRGKQHDEKLGFREISENLQSVDANTAKKIIESQREKLRDMIDRSSNIANNALPDLLARSMKRLRNIYSDEANRLRDLGKHNPSVREEEIRYYEERLAIAESVIDNAMLQLDAVRVLVTT